MIAVLSPAKTLDERSGLPPATPTRPRFEDEAATLAAAAAKLTRPKLAALMNISAALADLNVRRFRGFLDQPERPALWTFAGDVYTGFDVKSLDEAAIPFAQGHLRMLSGLYGLLRPLDLMRPYRLEMGTRWAPRRKALTDWWGGRIAELLARDVAEEGSGAVLNLASKEYWAAVDGRLPAGVQVIHVDFREADGRFISFNAKKARGMMARYLVEHQIADTDGMKGFDTDGYRFDKAASAADEWRFVKA